MELRKPVRRRRPALAGHGQERVRPLQRRACARTASRRMGLLRGFRVAVVCTTDDPVDSLDAHRALAGRPDPDTRVYPTWRPDRALAHRRRRRRSTHTSPGSRRHRASPIGGSFAALHRRARGAARRLSRDSAAARRITASRRCSPSPGRMRRSTTRSSASAPGKPIDARPRRSLQVRAALSPGGARSRARLGTAVPPGRACATTTRGFAARSGPTPASIRSATSTWRAPLSRFLDRLDESNQLAKTILYNLNPRDNELFATMIGNFQDGTHAGQDAGTGPRGGSWISSTA